jgi:hypothetical protein
MDEDRVMGGDHAARESRSQPQSPPLVSIGIPTYQRASTLPRAVESALTQSHPNIEIVICDDGSTDTTEALCEDMAARDARIRYLRSPVNQGLAANHNRLFAAMRGQYAMLLCDDDWLKDDYVERCLAELRSAPDLMLVCGTARYVQDGERVRSGVEFTLDEPHPAERIRTYLKGVDENGLMYGLMSRDVLAQAAPMRSVLGNDWLLVMAMLAQGKARTLSDTAILRELHGTSADFAKLTRTLGLPAWQARIPHLAIAWQVLLDVCGRAPVYRRLPVGERMRTALICPPAAIRWRSLAWHMTMPAFAALAGHRRTRWLWHGYTRLTRLAGAGRGQRSGEPPADDATDNGSASAPHA